MHRKAEERGEPLQVGIVIGIDPITLFAVCSRVPEGFEFIYASALKGEEIELFELENGIHVPHAEIAFEGYIHPDVRVKEGPLVDITKTYDLVRDEPLIQLTKMYHRENFIYHAIIPGGREHQILMGVPYEPLIFDAVSRVVQVKNLLLTEGGCCYLHAVIQIVKDREKDGRKAIFSAFSAHHSLKHVVIVDDDIDPFDPKDVEFAIATRVRGDRDIIIVPNVRGSTTDPSSKNGIGTKVGIDATKVISEAERFERIWR
jgi:UbiD family decarboxylase